MPLSALLGGSSQPFGALIRERRKALGWSQAELARKAGIPRTTLRSIEECGATAQLDIAQKLHRALSLPISTNGPDELSSPRT